MTMCSTAVALVLALDVSGSVSALDWDMQRRATAAALVSPEIVRLVQAQDSVAVMAVAWGSGVHELVGWHVVGGAADLHQVAEALESAPRPEAGQTDLAGLLRAVPGLLAGLRCHYARAVIDVSGDGPANTGEPDEARAALIANGITVNGLPIVTPSEPGLEAYYRERVTTPGGFTVPAWGWGAFGEAMRRKLVWEIALATGGTP